ncbi:MAG: hypothetical protein U0136_09830 [Bdellovibrionota bacterium]
MIITRHFIFGHMGRTGGDAVHQIMKELCRLGLESPLRLDEITDPKKHESLASQDRGARLAVATIRRLPAWELSFMHHRLRYPEPAIPPEGTSYGPEEMIRGRRADEHLIRMTADGTVPVDHWIQMERLREGLLKLLEQFYELTPTQRAAVLGFPTKQSLDYDHDYTKVFTFAELCSLYEANPRWAAVEREVYGNLLCDSIAVLRSGL